MKIRFKKNNDPSQKLFTKVQKRASSNRNVISSHLKVHGKVQGWSNQGKNSFSDEGIEAKMEAFSMIEAEEPVHKALPQHIC